MHDRLSINTLSLPAADLPAHVEMVARLGARAIGPGVEDITPHGSRQARRWLDNAGLAVATLTHRAFGFATAREADAARDRLFATIDIAEVIGAQTITLTSGGRGALDWPAAARRFSAAMAPCAERAVAAGVTLSLEPTSHLYADASIAHRLTDATTLATTAGIGVGIDLFACWSDADIDAAIAVAGPYVALVQVSDQVAGDRALPCRAVPGDGMIPLDRLVSAIMATGFDGFYDLEIIGPRLAAEGTESGLRRAGEWLTRALYGAPGASAGRKDKP